MALFQKWVNFVIDPLKPGCITSLKERIDTSCGVDPRSPEYKPAMRAIIFEHDILPPLAEFANDELDMMEITLYGAVTIWTRNRVWFVANEAGHIEKLRFVPRHPPAGEVIHESEKV